MENWKDVVGFEGLYEVSDFGNVRYVERSYYSGRNYSVKKHIKPDLLKKRINKYGYYDVTLRKGKKRRPHEVHRLVSRAFIRESNKGEVVNHLDLNKLNNNISNLEITTVRGNVNHYYKSTDMKCKSRGVRRQGIGFVSQITINKTRHYLGYFHSESIASTYYEQALDSFNKNKGFIYAKRRSGAVKIWY